MPMVTFEQSETLTASTLSEVDGKSPWKYGKLAKVLLRFLKSPSPEFCSVLNNVGGQSGVAEGDRQVLHSLPIRFSFGEIGEEVEEDWGEQHLV